MMTWGCDCADHARATKHVPRVGLFDRDRSSPAGICKVRISNETSDHIRPHQTTTLPTNTLQNLCHNGVTTDAVSRGPHCVIAICFSQGVTQMFSCGGLRDVARLSALTD